MDIKDLNKPQLIMLALLLSFVTSIATGITTVTLMQQAPESVTVPINRVVRETVEKIVQVPGKNTVQTIIVKEEDLVIDAIAKNKSAVFSVTKEVQDSEGKTAMAEAGRGFAVSKEGLIVVDGLLVAGGGVYNVENQNGTFKANFVSSDEKNRISFLKIDADSAVASKPDFTVPVFGDLSKTKTGQKIIIFGSGISSFIFKDSKDIKINEAKSNAGAMALNLDGEVLGIVLSGDVASFVSSEEIAEALKTVETKSEKTAP